MTQHQPLAADDPRRLGAYEIVARLGEGGQGVVYLGRSDTGEQVAIKLLHHALVADAEARTRFLREVAVAQRVARFSTAPVLHADLEGSRPYIISEYVPGPSLRELVINEGPRRGAALERLAISTATALAAIHRAGILHRDLKPANVLMGPEGPVVIDFGIARALDSPGATATGMAMGTPSYLAPEQLSGAPVSEAADVFAWGVTMVYAATGKPAFGSDSIPVVMNRILHEEPEIGPVEGVLGELVAACLSKDPAQRPTADELIVRLTGQPAPKSAVEPVSAANPIIPPQAQPAGPPQGAPQGPPPQGVPPQGAPPQGVPQQPGPQPGQHQNPGFGAPAGGVPAGGAVKGGPGGPAPHPFPPQGPGANPHLPPQQPDPAKEGAVRQRRTLTFALSGAAAAALLVVAGAVVVNANATPAKVIAVGNASESTPTDGSAAGQPADPPSAVVTNEPVPVPTLTGIDPEPTKTKKAKQPIIDVPTAIVTITPPANPTTSAPTAKPTQSKKPTSKPKRTDRVDPIGQETPTDDPSSSGQPTAKPTSKPTVKPTTKPTVKPTVKPTPKPTLKPNTASAAAVCGSGYKVIDSHSLSGKATIYLLYYSGKNCVVTMSRYVYPGKVAMNATLKVQKSGATGSDPGSFTAYAGPVRLAAAKTCVQWGGKWGTYSWTSGWSHCG